MTVELERFSFANEHLIACVSTRLGGVSAAPYDSLNLSFGVGDQPAAVLENRERVCAAMDFALDALTVANQVHAGDVVIVDGSHRGRGATTPADAVADADALVTAAPNVLLAILLADCVPIVLYDLTRRVVGIAHAGWRGTVAHVGANTVAAMVEHFGCDPCDIRAGIGPSIGPKSYEVGPDVAHLAYDAFPRAPEVVHRVNERTTFDLWAANAHDLIGAGLDQRNIESMDIDTFTTTDRWYSHRAGAPTGRFMAFAALPSL